MNAREKLVEKMAEADFNAVFPERKGDFEHPLCRDIAKGLLQSADRMLQVVLDAIEAGDVFEIKMIWNPGDNHSRPIIVLNPEFEKEKKGNV